MKRYELELFADYFQFYLQDEAADGDLSDSWTDEAVGRMLALAPGTIGVGTLRNVDVQAVIELYKTEPQLESDAWDHVVEAGLDILSGKIVVAGCADYFPEAVRIEVNPAHYRARLCISGLESIRSEWEDADDCYLVQLWPSMNGEILLLKQYVMRRKV